MTGFQERGCGNFLSGCVLMLMCAVVHAEFSVDISSICGNLAGALPISAHLCLPVARTISLMVYWLESVTLKLRLTDQSQPSFSVGATMGYTPGSLYGGNLSVSRGIVDLARLSSVAEILAQT